MKMETPEADARWVPGFQEKYAVWFREAKTLIEAHQYPAAFKTYPFPDFEETLKAFESILSPGGKIELPFRWEAPPVSWRGRQITEGA